MILWNVSSKKIEARFDGKVFEFAPNERKKLFNPDVYNHLMFKLRDKGLAILNEENITPEEEKKVLIAGLRARWKSVDKIVRSHRTMNRELERNKLGAEPPSEAVIDAVEECEEILEKLKKLEGERNAKIENYLNDARTQKAAEQIKDSEETVETEGAFKTKLTGRRPGRPKKEDALSST